MAIVGCYTVHLYCDTGGTAWGEECPFNYGSGEFAGQNERDCLSQARKRGWKFNRERTEAFCPRCSKGLKPDAHS